jgi:hypothetical protein
MNRFCWWLVERLSRRLEPGERDAVLGDIAESGETGHEALRDLLGLTLRRGAAVWREARSWLALAGLIAPVGMLRGRESGWVLRQFRTILTQGVLAESAMTRTDYIVRLACGVLLIACWAWIAGLILGSVFRPGVRRGARLGSLDVGRTALLAAAIAALTLILQVEDSRQALAYALWSSGGSLGRQLVWTPRVMPFLAILWEFGILTLAKEKNI